MNRLFDMAIGAGVMYGVQWYLSNKSANEDTRILAKKPSGRGTADLVSGEQPELKQPEGKNGKSVSGSCGCGGNVALNGIPSLF